MSDALLELLESNGNTSKQSKTNRKEIIEAVLRNKNVFDDDETFSEVIPNIAKMGDKLKTSRFAQLDAFNKKIALASTIFDEYSPPCFQRFYSLDKDANGHYEICSDNSDLDDLGFDDFVREVFCLGWYPIDGEFRLTKYEWRQNEGEFVPVAGQGDTTIIGASADIRWMVMCVFNDFLLEMDSELSDLVDDE